MADAFFFFSKGPLVFRRTVLTPLLPVSIQEKVSQIRLLLVKWFWHVVMGLPLVYLQPDPKQGTFLPKREGIPIGLLRVNLYKFITDFPKYLSKLLRRMSSC